MEIYTYMRVYSERERRCTGATPSARKEATPLPCRVTTHRIWIPRYQPLKTCPLSQQNCRNIKYVFCCNRRYFCCNRHRVLCCKRRRVFCCNRGHFFCCSRRHVFCCIRRRRFFDNRRRFLLQDKTRALLGQKTHLLLQRLLSDISTIATVLL